MTPTEIREAFGNYIDQWTTGRANDVDFWINEGIRAYVKMLLSPQVYGTEKTQRITEDLAPLILFEKEMVNSAGVITRPDDMYELLPHGIFVTALGTQYIARKRSMDWYFANRFEPLTKPLFVRERVIYLQYEDKFKVLPEANMAVKMTYVKKWLPFSNENTIPLEERCHDDVTKVAAAKYLLAINNQEGGKILMEQVFMES